MANQYYYQYPPSDAPPGSPMPVYRKDPSPDLSPISDYSSSSASSISTREEIRKRSEVHQFKSVSDISRERVADKKALKLLDKTMATQVGQLKSGMDVYRERGAESRALSLLDQAVSGTVPQNFKPTGSLASLTAGQLERYEKKLAELKAKEKEPYRKRSASFAAYQCKEKLAESTRPRKPKTAEDVRDPETISGMKCKLHWDREKYAKSKALRLLNEGYF